MLFFLSIYAIGFLASLYHIYKLSPQKRTKFKIIEILLLYQIVFSLGLTSIVAFFGLTFMAEYIAQLTDWPSCPFEQQLANVNLAFGVLGFLAIYFRRYFWLATILGFSIWIIGDGIHHLYLAIVHNNLSPGNIGVPLWTDFIVPGILLILLYMYFKNLPEEKGRG